jgi:hypothetical protein
MQVTGACTLMSRGAGSSVTLSAAAGPSANGLTNNTSDPIIEGVGRGSVKYTFTIDSEYQWNLFAGTRGSVQNRGGGTGEVNRPDNNATVRFEGIFEQSISGTNFKQQEMSGTIPAGTYVIEGLAQTAATGSQITSANISFSLTLTPTNSTTIRWNNPEGGSFQNAINWDPQTIPAGNDNAAFDLAGSYTVSLDSDVTHNALLGNGLGANVTFELNGHTYTVNRVQTGGLIGGKRLLHVLWPVRASNQTSGSGFPFTAGGRQCQRR